MSKIDRVHKEIAESEYNSYKVGKAATISQDKYNGGYKTEGMSISPKLDEIMYSEDEEKE